MQQKVHSKAQRCDISAAIRLKYSKIFSIFLGSVVVIATLTRNSRNIRSVFSPTWLDLPVDNAEIEGDTYGNNGEVTIAANNDKNFAVGADSDAPINDGSVSTVRLATSSPSITPSASPTAETVEGLHCALWDELNLDLWWQEHPEWEPSRQYTNSTHDCFTRIANPNRVALNQRIYANQFHNNCSNLQARLVSQQGFGASLNTLVMGLWQALSLKIPFQQSKYWEGFRWIYTPPYNDTHPELNSWAACKSQDINCYFLPLSNCVAPFSRAELQTRKTLWLRQFRVNSTLEEEFVWAHEYVMRPNQKVRRRLSHMLATEAPKVPTPCTWMHVRRSDATTEQSLFPRNFYWLQEYLDVGNISSSDNTTGDANNQSIFVLTDDQTTIEEAHLLHPQYNWIFWNRTRHRGGAKRHSHFPSSDEGLEVLVLLAEIELAGTCRKAVHGTSNMVEFFRNSMIMKHGIDNIELAQVDSDKEYIRQHKIPAAVFVKELEEKLRTARAQLTNTAQSS